MSSINDEVENILNGKFDSDMGLGYLNDVNYSMKGRGYNHAPMGQMGPGGPHHMPQQPMPQPLHTPQMGHVHPLNQHPTRNPSVSKPSYRATPQQMAAQLANHHGPPPGHAAHLGQPTHPIERPPPHQVHPGNIKHPKHPAQQQHPMHQPRPAQGPPRPVRPPKVAEKINCLLHINNELIRQLSSAPMRSPVHAECLRRLEVNIAYLHALASDSRAQQAMHMMPSILLPPPEVPSLAEPYRRLQNLDG